MDVHVWYRYNIIIYIILYPFVKNTPVMTTAISVAIWVFNKFWCILRTGLYLPVGYCMTCLNLLFSIRHGSIFRSKGVDLRTEARTVPPAKDVGHLGDVPDQRRSVQFDRRQLSAGNEDGHGKELLGNESVGARPSKEIDV